MPQSVSRRRINTRHPISAEIAGLDPVADADRIVYLSTSRMLPRLGRRFVFNLLYTLGFLRISGQPAGALTVDRVGKVHRAPDRRADDTISHFLLWLQKGAGSERGRESLAEVRRVHDQIARHHPFSNDSLVHATCLFAIQFQELLDLIGAPGFTQVEREAQAAQWRAIGESLGASGIPASWQGMREHVRAFEASPGHYGRSEAGARCAESLIGQLQRRWLPPGLRWSGRLLVLCLLDEHVLAALDLRKPPRPLVAAVRGTARTLLTLEGALLGEPRRLVELTSLAVPASPGPAG